MFGRRIPLTIFSRLRRVVWPDGGWRRWFHYVSHRVRRLPGTPERIAAGVACGVAVSFTPFIGLHFLLACGTAWLLRGNLIAAAVGTVAGNPWTFPFIWAWILALGRWMLGDESQYNIPMNATLVYMFERPLLLLWPMTLGGVPTAVVAWFVSYYPVKRMVAGYQKARLKRIERRKAKRGAKRGFRLSARQAAGAAPDKGSLPGSGRDASKDRDGEQGGPAALAQAQAQAQPQADSPAVLEPGQARPRKQAAS